MLHRGKHRTQPVTIGDRIIIDEENEIAASLVESTIAREARSWPGLKDTANRKRQGIRRGGFDDARRVVARRVVDDDAFDRGILRKRERLQTIERLAQRERAIVRRYRNGQ